MSTPSPDPGHDAVASPLLDAALAACAGLSAERRARLTQTLDLLDSLRCDAETRASAAWFALAETEPAAWQAAQKDLPAPLVRLVEGQFAAEKVWALHAERSGASEGLRRLLLAIIRDVRVVFVLLVRQLLRMREAATLPPEEARRLAQLTADIHAPLANRLGIWQLKWELEDLAFRYTQPDVYKRIARLLDERRADRESFIRECIDTLGKALADAGIKAEIAGRPKHIHSIWKKMQRKHLDFDELYDIRALRVLVDDVAGCYAALGVVHGLWPHIPKEFDDYIARPKQNGYQSLHTAVVGPGGRSLEVQIRTHAMHHDNELGVAAHWRYKEGGSADAQFEKRVAWMRSLLESRSDDDAGLMADFENALEEDRVYVLTPRGEVVDMSRGATVLDFAYHIHTDVGHRCRGAKVNGRIVPLTHTPRSGDRVEILTAKNGEPSRDWLSPHTGYLHTGRARDKVRAWFRRRAHAANLQAGKHILERELRRLALSESDPEKLAPKLGLQHGEELLVALALGEIAPGHVARVLTEPETPAPAPAAPAAAQRSRRSGRHAGGGRRRPDDHAGALLPAPAGRRGARLHHQGSWRVGAPHRLRGAGAPGPARPQARDRRRLGARAATRLRGHRAHQRLRPQGPAEGRHRRDHQRRHADRGVLQPHLRAHRRGADGLHPARARFRAALDAAGAPGGVAQRDRRAASGCWLNTHPRRALPALARC